MRGRARADAQGRGDGLAPLLIGKATTLEHVSGVLLFAPIRVVMSPSGGLGYSNAKTARRALLILRLRVRPGITKPINSLTNSPENKLRISRGKIVTRYSGVISPLLSNLYLHWFDKMFHRKEGPAIWAKAKLVRYADDCAPRAQRAEEGPMCVTV